MAKCRFCGGEANIKLRYARLWLCEECFKEYYERKVKEALEKFKVSGTIAVAVSAGKDSAALLSALSEILEKKRIFGIHINLGIEGISEKAEELAFRQCKALNVKCKVINLNEEYGISISGIAKTTRKVCSICGLFRRYILNKVAYESKANWIATGHTADDIATSIVRSFVLGSFDVLARIRTVSEPNEEAKLVGKIKPLYRTFEFENKLYCEINGIEYLKESCPLGKTANQHIFKEFLSTLEQRMPEIKLRIIRNYFKNRELFEKFAGKQSYEYKLCKRCGFGTTASNGICKFCRLIEKYGSTT